MNPEPRKKALIILCGDEYIRNYLTTDAFDEIERTCDAFYIGADTITLRQPLEAKPRFRGFYKFDRVAAKSHFEIFNVLMWRNRAKSSSFEFRMIRHTDASFDRGRGMRNFAGALRRYPERAFRAWKEKARLSVLGSDLVFPLYEKRVMQTLPVNESIRDLVKSVAPDIVIFPSSGYEPAGDDVARICSELRIPSLFLIDNWDNLSSKSIMWARPDYLAVWGEQTVEHAVAIQGMDRERVTPIGTARYDQYFRLRDRPLKSHFAHPYVLFVGTALAFNEAAALEAINAIIEKNASLFRDIKLVYRPHPWRQGKDSIVGKDLPHVLIDPQLADWYAGARGGAKLQPDLNYYPSLLKNAEFIVGGLTSMIIESQIFWKRFLALAYPEKGNLTNQHNALKYYIHFRGLEDLGGVDICRDMERLPEQFVASWNRRFDVRHDETDRTRGYFLSDGPEPYKVRLGALVQRIFRSAESPPPERSTRAAPAPRRPPEFHGTESVNVQ